MPLPSPPAETIAELRQLVTGADARDRGTVLPFGVDVLDQRLAQKGLSTASLHEVAAAAPSLSDEAAATLFIAGTAARFAGDRTTVLWAVTRFDLYAPGLEQVGLAPGRVMFVDARDDVHVLAAMEDALRDGSVAAVVGEVTRADMTATRRLQLAAAESSTPAFLFRRRRRAGACPLSDNSAASTRWRIGVAPSSPTAQAGIGRARWTVELARQRNGAPFSLILEGCDATGRLALPAAAADRAAASAGAAARAA